MAKKWFYICAGLLLLSMAYALGTGNAVAQVRSVEGRYTIVTGSADAFLLNTATGDNWYWDTTDWASRFGVKHSATYWCPSIRGTNELIDYMVRANQVDSLTSNQRSR